MGSSVLKASEMDKVMVEEEYHSFINTNMTIITTSASATSAPRLETFSFTTTWASLVFLLWPFEKIGILD